MTIGFLLNDSRLKVCGKCDKDQHRRCLHLETCRERLRSFINQREAGAPPRFPPRASVARHLTTTGPCIAERARGRVRAAVRRELKLVNKEIKSARKKNNLPLEPLVHKAAQLMAFLLGARRASLPPPICAPRTPC